MSKIFAPEWDTEIVDPPARSEREPEWAMILRASFDQAYADWRKKLGLTE